MYIYIVDIKGAKVKKIQKQTPRFLHVAYKNINTISTMG